jgi:hypothetical protein
MTTPQSDGPQDQKQEPPARLTSTQPDVDTIFSRLRWICALRFFKIAIRIAPDGDCKTFLLKQLAVWVEETRRQSAIRYSRL